MSTKIYTGIKFETSNIFEIFELLQDHQTEVKQKIEKKIAEFIITKAVNSFDKDTIYKKPIAKDYAYEAYNQLRERFYKIKKTQERDPIVDFEVSLAIIPFEGNFYGIYFSEHQELFNLFLKHEKVSDFSYWNNTDKPSRISVKEWKIREEIWNEIFEKNRTPQDAGFVKTFNNELPYLSLSDVAKYWNKFSPNFEKRLNFWNEEIYCSRELDKKFPQQPTDNDGKVDVSAIMSAFFDVRSDNSPESQQRKLSVRQELEQLLKKDITLTDIGINKKKKKTNKIG